MSSIAGLDGMFSFGTNHSTYYYDRSLERLKRKKSLLCDRVKLKKARLRLNHNKYSRLGRTLDRPYFNLIHNSEKTLTEGGVNVDGSVEKEVFDSAALTCVQDGRFAQRGTSTTNQKISSPALFNGTTGDSEELSPVGQLPLFVPMRSCVRRDVSPDLRFKNTVMQCSGTTARLPTREQLYLKPSHLKNITLGTGSLSSRTLAENVQLAEKVAATKMYFEFFYENLEANRPSQGTSLRQLRLFKSRQAKGEQDVLKGIGFDIVQEIGRGSFGVVRLVRQNFESSLDTSSVDGTDSRPASVGLKTQSRYFAMKSIKKSASLITAQEAHLRCERDVLVRAAKDCRWIVKLHCAFQDENSLHLVMDFEIGGDFLQLLIRTDKISEDATRFYIAEMVLAVEETHRLGIVHRDLKPDNFLISAEGHLKLADFGLAYDGRFGHSQKFFNDKRRDMLARLEVDFGLPESLHVNGTIPFQPSVSGSPSQLTSTRSQFARLPHSLVGTSQYMAPEVLQNTGYDGRCDWWSIGIMLFECLFAYTPFCRENRDATKRAIVRHREVFSIPEPAQEEDRIGHDTRDLIHKLIIEREYRLGSKKYRHPRYTPQYVVHDDATEIKGHMFFQKIQWDVMHMLPPPWIPGLRRDRHSRPGTDLFATPVEGKSSSDGSMSAAKDPILRDKRFSTAVMQTRKNSAFLGYEWNGSVQF